ncbi:MAG: redox-regulated ATPase YchF [Deltaproteobacteria bacterium HGW-Deltaproteobacteria-14]|jgi:hypothetical protein|nr:MAG: redox-regulated ATPase YchF [Deltaproteobacteria bacterium HGW-Deltaproteobacteria-14]
MHVGLCGYPGAGKSTVFEALAPGATASRSGVSYGNIKVPDARVDALAGLFSPKKTTFAEITFVDVGGGGSAATGAFTPDVVQHMRNVDVMVHVVRGFANPMVATPMDPRRDDSLFNDEILLLDLGVMERRLQRFHKERRQGAEVEVTERCVAHLEDGGPLRTLALSEDDRDTLRDVQLLSLKPLIVLFNLGEAEWGEQEYAALRELKEPAPNTLSMAICGSIEVEIAQLDEEDQGEFLATLGLREPARHEFVRASYRLLDLISFLTAGKDECRAWPIHRGTVARRAARTIHSDIERGFIRAEVYRWEALIEHGSEAALKSKGLMRLEGKEYVVADGDVINFRHNV